MSDHECTIALSKDGAHNYVAPTIHDLGATGDFQKQIIRRRLGMARSMVVRFSVSSPIRCSVLASEVMAESEG
jgi:hypothetical protein